MIERFVEWYIFEPAARAKLFGYGLMILGTLLLAIAVPRWTEAGTISLCNVPCTTPAFVHYADNVLKVYCSADRSTAWLTIQHCANPKATQPTPGTFNVSCS